MRFRMETQKRANFLETLKSTDETNGTYIFQFEAATGREFVCMHACDDVAFATRLITVENINIEHTSEVEEPPLRVVMLSTRHIRICGRAR